MVKLWSAQKAYFDQMWTDVAYHWSVSLNNRREAHLQLSFGMTGSFHDGLGLLTPRYEEFVVIHIGYHIIHL